VAFGSSTGLTGAFALALLTALAVIAGTVRRRLDRRRLRAVLVGRLATLSRDSARPGGPANVATLGVPAPAERGHA
jgi:hypothetical protein